MSKILVLGANGFIGSHLVDSLVDQGDRVRAFDKFGSNNPNFLNHKSIEKFEGDFLNRADIRTALKGIDYVFHMISTTTPATSEDDPFVDMDTNVRMSIELLEECVSAKIKKIIFPSTGGAIYGDTKSDAPIDENTIPKPISPYAIGKLTIENYLRYFNKKFNLSTLTYRISNPYGERHSPSSRQGVIPIFLELIANDRPITVLGDGLMVRDYIYVKDVARLTSKSFKDAKLPLYNLGSGQGVTVDRLVKIIKKVTKKDIKIKRHPKPPTFVQKVILDTALFKKEFNLRPEVSLEEGVKMTWEYIQSQTQSTHKNLNQ